MLSVDSEGGGISPPWESDLEISVSPMALNWIIPGIKGIPHDLAIAIAALAACIS